MTTLRGSRRIAGLLGGTLVAAALLPAGPAAAAASALKPANDGAKITAQKWLTKSVVDLTVQSPAAGQSVKVRVIVPKGWSRTAKRTYPVVYAYAGGGGDDQSTWMVKGGIEPVTRGWDAMVVMPYSGQSGGFVDWYNYGKRGKPKWETYLTAEVPQLIDRNLRGSSNRAVMGISSGGTGAFAHAARHPGLYKYAASFSGGLRITGPMVPWVLFTAVAFNQAKDPLAIYGIPGLDDANWRANDPYTLAAKLKGVGMYISSGTTGEHGPLDPDLTWEEALKARLVGGIGEQAVGDATKMFVDRINQLGIPAKTNLYGDGWHQWAYWNREVKVAWPLMMKAIGAKKV